MNRAVRMSVGLAIQVPMDTRPGLKALRAAYPTGSATTSHRPSKHDLR